MQRDPKSSNDLILKDVNRKADVLKKQLLLESKSNQTQKNNETVPVEPNKSNDLIVRPKPKHKSLYDSVLITGSDSVKQKTVASDTSKTQSIVLSKDNNKPAISWHADNGTFLAIILVLALLTFLKFRWQVLKTLLIIYEKVKYVWVILYFASWVYLFVYSGSTIINSTKFFKGSEFIFWFFYFIVCLLICSILAALLKRTFDRNEVCSHGVIGGIGKRKCAICDEHLKRRTRYKGYRTYPGHYFNPSEEKEILTESPIEDMFWAELKKNLNDEQIKLFTPQYNISNGKYRIDFAIPTKKIAIELDGHKYHTTKEQITHDYERERYLQRLGWSIIRFTGTEIHRNLYKCIDDLIAISGLRQTAIGDLSDSGKYSSIKKSEDTDDLPF